MLNKVTSKAFVTARILHRFNHTSNHFKDVKITKVTVYQVGLPLHEGSYKWSGGNSIEEFDATVVRISTNVPGIEGFGENTPLGPAYLAAYPEGTRAGIAKIAPSLLHQNPTSLHQINYIMDCALKGHPYVKSALDMACWDILGKVSQLPVCELLGGRHEQDSFPLYRAISQDTPEKMVKNVLGYVKEGYRIFQLKVGGDPAVDIDRILAVRRILDDTAKEMQLAHMPLMCDANTGWKMHQAVQVIRGISSSSSSTAGIYIEQPCLTYEQCLSVRKMCPFPFVIDEAMDGLDVLHKIIADHSADMINLKISKVGGLSKARIIRDVAVQAGLVLNIEDTWGGDIVTAAIAHLAHSTHPDHLLCSTDFNSYGPKCIAKTTAQRKGGRMSAPTEPGLGVEPVYEALGKPVFEVSI